MFLTRAASQTHRVTRSIIGSDILAHTSPQTTSSRLKRATRFRAQDEYVAEPSRLDARFQQALEGFHTSGHRPPPCGCHGALPALPDHAGRGCGREGVATECHSSCPGLLRVMTAHRKLRTDPSRGHVITDDKECSIQRTLHNNTINVWRCACRKSS